MQIHLRVVYNRSMKITVINGTNRKGNESMKISRATKDVLTKKSIDNYLVTLKNFDTLFHGDYLNLGNANPAQKRDLENIISADILIFIVPTYHSGIPSPLKNFFDIVKMKELYEGKVIGFIGTDEDLGARQAVQVINGIMSYDKVYSFVAPRITLLGFADIDMKRLEEHIDYLIAFVKK